MGESSSYISLTGPLRLVEAHTIRYIFNRGLATIAAGLLETGIAFLGLTVAMVMMGLQAALTILSGRLCAMVLMNISGKQQRRG